MDRCFVAYDAGLKLEFQGDASVPTHPNTSPASTLVGGRMLDCHYHQNHSIGVLDSQNLLLRGLKFGVGENPGFM